MGVVFSVIGLVAIGLAIWGGYLAYKYLKQAAGESCVTISSSQCLCRVGIGQDKCNQDGGIWRAKQDCSDDFKQVCDGQLLGSCHDGKGGCQNYTTEADCDSSGGTWSMGSVC